MNAPTAAALPYDALAQHIEALLKDPAVAEVKVTKYPLNVNSEQALTGNTRDAAEQAGVADFKIALTLKPNA